MRRCERVGAVLTALTALLAGSGCAHSVDVRIDPAPIQDGWAGCRTVRPYVSAVETNQRIDAGAPPSTFVATALIRCVSGPPRTDTARSGISAIEERSDQVSELVTTLELPTQRPKGKVSCPAPSTVRRGCS